MDALLSGAVGNQPGASITPGKTFDLPTADAGRCIILEIDGAMSYSAVWCNGRLVGGWPYGYASYQLDLTPYLKPVSANTLAIRIDNPDESSRWYPGGGLYRNVWLVKTAPVHVAQWGTTVVTSEVGANGATVNVSVHLQNASPANSNVQVLTELFQLIGKAGATTRVSATKPVVSDVVIEPGKAALVAQPIPVRNPQLWSIDAPNLYVAVTRLTQNGRIVDEYETRFGIRTAEFTAADGFHLNGKRVPLQGVCMHHDLGALGAAFNPRAAERQLEILKEMGVNAIRTAHNPPATELLDLCDPAHPALAAFPTTRHTDWNWWYPIHRASPLILDGLPQDLRPIVQVIDDWYTNRRLGLVVEARVGKGRLLLCGADLPAADDPVNRQLLASLLRYMGDASFTPSVTLEAGQVRGLLKAGSVLTTSPSFLHAASTVGLCTIPGNIGYRNHWPRLCGFMAPENIVQPRLHHAHPIGRYIVRAEFGALRPSRRH